MIWIPLTRNRRICFGIGTTRHMVLKDRGFIHSVAHSWESWSLILFGAHLCLMRMFVQGDGL